MQKLFALFLTALFAAPLAAQTQTITYKPGKCPAEARRQPWCGSRFLSDDWRIHLDLFARGF